MHFLNYRVRILIGIAVCTLVGLAIWGMASLESYYRNITLATMPLQMLMMAVNAVVFVFLYMSVFRGGFSKVGDKKVKATDVNVRFSDVIGMDEAKAPGIVATNLNEQCSQLCQKKRAAGLVPARFRPASSPPHRAAINARG